MVWFGWENKMKREKKKWENIYKKKKERERERGKNRVN